MNKMQTGPAKNVDEYLQNLAETQRVALEKLRAVIKKTAPKADEMISYQIPAYKHFGWLVYFAAFKNHCSFFVLNKDILKIFEAELKPFKTAGTTVQFQPEKPLPTALVTKIVKLRMSRNQELQEHKNSMKQLKAGGKIKNNSPDYF